MAFCTSCGATVPDGVAFCTNCGKPVASASRATPGASAPRFAAFAGNGATAGPAVTRTAGKPNKTLIIAIVAAVLVIGLVFGILAIAGVFGPKLPTGTWTLTFSTENGLNPGSTVLMISKDGSGYLKENSTYDGYTYIYSYKVNSTDSYLMLDGELATYTRDKDQLTLMWDGDTYMFTRSGGVEKRTLPQTGTYRVVSVTWRNENELSYYTGAYIQINDGNFGMFFDGDDNNSILVGEYLLTLDGDSVYYTYDGTNITFQDGASTFVFMRMG